MSEADVLKGRHPEEGFVNGRGGGVGGGGGGWGGRGGGGVGGGGGGGGGVVGAVGGGWGGAVCTLVSEDRTTHVRKSARFATLPVWILCRETC